MSTPSGLAPSHRPAFGAVLSEVMAVANYRHGAWGEHEIRPTGPVAIHPAAHALHYASSCFEGFKAYRGREGAVNVFRMDRHIARMRQSARALALPEPDALQLARIVGDLIGRCRADVPPAPGALYLRPLLFGTTSGIGAAAVPPDEAQLIVLACPVWDYFAGGERPLRIFVDDQHQRTAPHLGMVKTGGNYAAAIGPTQEARRQHQVDQVLFCPGGQVQETGAANFILIRDGHLLTRNLDSTFLHGVTRDSLLTLARDEGFVVDERVFHIDEMLSWVRDGEAALAGTAAVLAGVGTLHHGGSTHRVGGGEVGPVTKRLRAQLVAIQQGQAPDRFGWLTAV